jgi:16S rRNA A1518/A1519 N6-dimethyltransferase RsmA/KsgA/DIM1 with predicted DNA glycosylase/AP lyase activity
MAMLKQNSFRDRNLVRTTIIACSITKSDIVYEIEPEDELITSELAAVARKVIVLEKQPDRAHFISSQLQNIQNVEVCEADFLRYEIQDRGYKVFSNITSSIPSEIIKKILSARVPPLDSFLIVRDDIANRYSGTPKETESSVLVKPKFEVTILRKFRRVDFDPEPSAELVLLNLKMRKRPLISPDDENIYRSFIKFSFEAGKKGLDAGYANIFSNEQWKRITKDLDVKLSIKPAELSFSQWLQLFGYFSKFIPDTKRMPLLKKKKK